MRLNLFVYGTLKRGQSNHERFCRGLISVQEATVRGCLYDPEERLPILDDLEGFRPGEKSFYRRVLIPTTLLETGATVPAWAYALRSASGLYLRGGRWPDI